MYQPLETVKDFDLAINQQIKTRIIKQGEEKIWAQTSANGWSTEMAGLADFMFEFWQISAKTTGGLPFLAEIKSKPAAAGMLYIYDNVALLAGASTIPKQENKARRQPCSRHVYVAPPGRAAQLL